MEIKKKNINYFQYLLDRDEIINNKEKNLYRVNNLIIGKYSVSVYSYEDHHLIKNIIDLDSNEKILYIPENYDIMNLNEDEYYMLLTELELYK